MNRLEGSSTIDRRPDDMADRIGRIDWDRVARDLNTGGYASLGSLLDQGECESVRALYDRDDLFRGRIVMARHHFGRGEYKYFRYPLPRVVHLMRQALYPHLASIGNSWQSLLGDPVRFPAHHDDFIARCHAAGQVRPTPLLLRYEAGDYNCLHQDLYGKVFFPFQVVLLLSDPAADFTGGEFVLTEQRPRRQSRADVVPLALGEAAVFAVNERPVKGARGYYRARLRHGVGRLRSGLRQTLGIIFHDAL